MLLLKKSQDKLLQAYNAALKFSRFFKGRKKALFGLSITLLFILMATIGPHIVHLDLTTRYMERFQPPSFKHILGTDFVGRDIFSQIVHGSSDVIGVAFIAALFSVAIGVTIGSFAGFSGGWIDIILTRIMDILLVIPSFPIMMVFAATFRVRDPVSIGLILAIWMWAGLARSIRAQILSFRQREFIEAAKLLGLSSWHIVFKELTPNLMSYILVNFVRMARGALTASVGLMFLGIIPYSPTNWGVMMNLALFQSGSIYVPKGLFYTLSPMLCIIFFQYGLLCVANVLEEVFNPRLRDY
ncbi:MAG: ABC transporter permease [Candidatus Omnitrophica bacterium]|nr:ABC transporter permease [Candidatus Omnitrophota bacterium]